MNSLLRKCCPALLFAVSPALLLGQNTPKLTYEQMEQFLKTAKIVKIKNLNTGITNSRRASLDDGTMQHEAHVQSIDEHKAKFEGERSTEINFVDSWKYNIAAYRLGRILNWIWSRSRWSAMSQAPPAQSPGGSTTHDGSRPEEKRSERSRPRQMER